MEYHNSPLMKLVFALCMAAVFAVLASEAVRGCSSAQDVQTEIREDWEKVAARAIRDGGTATSDTGTATTPDDFTGRLFVRPEFEYSDNAPDAADDLDLRRDAGAQKPVDNTEL